MILFARFYAAKICKTFLIFQNKTKKGGAKTLFGTPEVDDGRDERSELPVYYNCRKERNRFFAALRMTARD